MSKLTQRIASLLASARLSARDLTHTPADAKRASVARAALIAASRRDLP